VAESSVKADLEQELTSGRPGVGGRVHARGVKRSVRDASTAVQGMEGRGVNDMEQHVGWLELELDGNPIELHAPLHLNLCLYAYF
jgi:hypothetical protein